MNRKCKVMAISVITALVLAAFPLAAQTSNTTKATAGTIGTDVDAYLDYQDWQDVSFDKWFGFVGYDNSLSAGYARYFGKLYLGAYFTGNFADLNTRTGSETIVGTYDPAENLIQTDKTIQYDSQAVTSTNNLNFLIGIAGQGIKVGIYESLTVKDKAAPGGTATETDTKDGHIRYQDELVDYSSVNGYLMPVVGWGSTFNLGSVALKPTVQIGFDIHQGTEISIRKNYNTYFGKTVDGVSTNYSGYNDGYLAPDISVDAELVSTKGDAELTFGIGYGLNFKIYANAYDVAGFSDTAKGTVSWNTGSTSVYERDSPNGKWEDRQAQLTFNDQTYFNHRITPSFRHEQNVGDRFKFGFSAKIPVTITAQTEDKYQDTLRVGTWSSAVDKTWDNVTTEKTHVTYGSTKTDTFTVSPQAAIGGSYTLVPKRFIINAGLGAILTTFTSETVVTAPNGAYIYTSETKDGFGNVTNKSTSTSLDSTWGNGGTVNPADKVQTSTTWDGLSATVSGGFTFLFTDNIALDAVASVGGSYVNIANVKLLLTIKK
ncbi:hypothetical protein FACS189444_0400 [Spirochaetia bacterium]|nr:hypothetical protein FACS189444_0400 [Spirochaetia bacterium]